MGHQQASIFEFLLEDYKINKPIRLIELFSGIGAQAKALEQLGADFDHWRTCDWAVPSILAYDAIHGFHLWETENSRFYNWPGMSREEKINCIEGISTNYNEPMKRKQIEKKSDGWINTVIESISKTNNLVNIMNVHAADLGIEETDKYCYVMTYSFPCQDLSLAGNKKGMAVSQKEGGTRSGLLWEVERILDELYNESREREESTLPQVLLMENVPEVVGKKNIKEFQKWRAKLESLGYSNYCEILNAKDYGLPQNRRRCFMVSILGEYNYTFPRKRKLDSILYDFLEPEIDPKYLLSEKMTKFLVAEDTKKYERKKAFEYVMRTVTQSNVACALTTRMGRGATDTYIPIKNNNSKGFEYAFIGDGIDISTRMQYHRGTVQHQSCQTITTMGGSNVGVVIWNQEEVALKKLTPLECLKLMGFDEYDYNRLREIGQTDTQIYHEAGDSIVVTVLMSIFGQLLDLPYEGIIDEYVNSLKTNTCDKGCDMQQ